MAPTPRRRLIRRTLLGITLLGVGGGGVWAAARYSEPLPAATVSVSVPPSETVGSLAPAIAVPTAGSFAEADSESGVVAAHDAARVRPMASITKTMTALAVLEAHPLAPGADGPVHLVGAPDVAVLNQVVAEGGTHVNVSVGEQLTQRQLLLGMMLPSANNFAIMLGRWVDGSDPAFVARLNRMAASMGMTSTHFADADGVDPHTVSTADDLLILGRAAVADPTLVEIMSHPDARLPDGTAMQNIDTLVGTVPGWLGIKTGHTGDAGYCLLYAARRTVVMGTPPVLVVGVVLGQAQRQDTFDAARKAAEADFAAFVPLILDAQTPEATGGVTTAWGADTGIRLTPSGTGTILVRGGTQISLLFSPISGASMPAAGERVGDVVATLAGRGSIGRWPVVTTGDLAGPPWWWRLRR